MNLSTKHRKKTLQSIQRARQKLDQVSGVACNSTYTNHSDDHTYVSDSSSVKSPHGNPTNISLSAAKKKSQSSTKKYARVSVYGEDEGDRKTKLESKDVNRAESRRRFKQKCKDHRGYVTASYENRIFSEGQKSEFDALLGIRGVYADHMPASDLKLRGVMGRRIIDEMHSLWLRANSDPRLKVYFITFLDDAYHINERNGVVETKRFMDKVQAVIRQYTSFNAFGVIENQAITNYPKGTSGKTLSVHAHVVCWGYDSDDHSRLVDRAKGFQTTLTEVPIHVQKIQMPEGDFTCVGRYLAKPPSEGKVVNYKKLAEGKACLKSITKGMKKYHHLRLFEYGAKLPMEHTILGVREGAVTRRKIVTLMNAWQKTREGTEMQIGEQVDRLFEKFLANNKKFKNYDPIRVIYKRTKR